MNAITEGVKIAEDQANARDGLFRMVAECVGKSVVDEQQVLEYLDTAVFPQDLTFVVDSAADVDAALAGFKFA